MSEAAYLAALPKAPENYHPFRDAERAVERRNWVVDRLVENGYIRSPDADTAKAAPLDVKPRRRGTKLVAAEYFAEEVRRKLIEMYGAEKLYDGGLSVRTTLNPRLQREARRALQSGLVAFDEKRGFREPVAKVDISADWGTAVGAIEALSDVLEWRLAVVLSAGESEAVIGL